MGAPSWRGASPYPRVAGLFQVQQSGQLANRLPTIESLLELLLNEPDRRLRQRVLAAMRADRDREPEPRKALRPKQGLIQNTICAILAEATEPLQAHAVRNEVETRLGRPISLDTVTSCLSGSARDSRSTVARVGYGLYAWRHQPSPRNMSSCRRRTESKNRQPLARARANIHPTVKPIEVMRWLVRLITLQCGLVLDPFAGRGTTGCAAVFEDRRFVGIEREGSLPADHQGTYCPLGRV